MNKTHIIEYLLKELNSNLQLAAELPSGGAGEAVTFAKELLEILACNNKNFVTQNTHRIARIKKALHQAENYCLQLAMPPASASLRTLVQATQKEINTALTENKKLIKIAYQRFHAPQRGREH